MTEVRLTTTVPPMTMNWYFAESMIAERTRGLLAATADDGRNSGTRGQCVPDGGRAPFAS